MVKFIYLMNTYDRSLWHCNCVMCCSWILLAIGLPIMFTGCNDNLSYSCGELFDGTIYTNGVGTHKYYKSARAEGEITEYYAYAIAHELNLNNKTIYKCKLRKHYTESYEKAKIQAENEYYIGKTIHKVINKRTDECFSDKHYLTDLFNVGFGLTLIATFVFVAHYSYVFYVFYVLK